MTVSSQVGLLQLQYQFSSSIFYPHSSRILLVVSFLCRFQYELFFFCRWRPRGFARPELMKILYNSLDDSFKRLIYPLLCREFRYVLCGFLSFTRQSQIEFSAPFVTPSLGLLWSVARVKQLIGTLSTSWNSKRERELHCPVSFLAMSFNLIFILVQQSP